LPRVLGSKKPPSGKDMLPVICRHIVSRPFPHPWGPQVIDTTICLNERTRFTVIPPAQGSASRRYPYQSKGRGCFTVFPSPPGSAIDSGVIVRQLEGRCQALSSFERSVTKRRKEVCPQITFVLPSVPPLKRSETERSETRVICKLPDWSRPVVKCSLI
jgi:hypothetical protein